MGRTRKPREHTSHEQGRSEELLYGRQPVVEMLRAGRRKVHQVLVSESSKDSSIIEKIQSIAGRRGLPLRPVRHDELSNRVGHDINHQGVAALVSPYPYVDLDDALSGVGDHAPLLLLLDHLQDPQNVGSILRTADAVGVDAVVLPKDRSATITPAVVRASSGGAEHIKIARVVNLARTMRTLKERNIWIAGLEGSPEAQLYTKADLTGPLAVVIGSEGRGMGRLIRETCDFLIRLPMGGRIGSLNASVAAGVTLYEVFRRRSELTN